MSAEARLATLIRSRGQLHVDLLRDAVRLVVLRGEGHERDCEVTDRVVVTPDELETLVLALLDAAHALHVPVALGKWRAPRDRAVARGHTDPGGAVASCASNPAGADPGRRGFSVASAPVPPPGGGS